MVRLDAARVFGWHLCAIGCLALGHLVGTLLLAGVGPFSHDEVRRLFDLDGEASPGAFFSSLALLACAGAALLASRAETDTRLRRFWVICAALAAFLAADEAVGIHEIFGAIGHRITSGQGIFTISWWVVYPFLIAPVLIAALPGFVRLDGATIARLLLAGLVFLAGAVGMEIVESAARDAFVTANHLRVGAEIDWDAYARALPTAIGAAYQHQQHWFALIEEPLEMLGAALALRAILLHAGRIGAAVQLTAGSGLTIRNPPA